MGEAKRRKKLDPTWGKEKLEASNPDPATAEIMAEVKRRFSQWEHDCIGTSVSDKVLYDQFFENLAYAKEHGICIYYGGKEVANPKPPIRGEYKVKVFVAP